MQNWVIYSALGLMLLIFIIVIVCWSVRGKGSKCESAKIEESIDESDRLVESPRSKPLLRRFVQRSKKPGRPVKNNDFVTVHYNGRLFDSQKEFDSSYKRNQPLTFQVGQGKVIMGWDAVFPSLRVGDKIQLRVPSQMAYGEKGADPVIPPNSDLEFDIEVLKTESPHRN